MITSDLLLSSHEMSQLNPHELAAYYGALEALDNIQAIEQFLLGMPLEKRRGYLESKYKTDPEVIEATLRKWHLWRREKQVIPDHCECHQGNWATWLILAGRGFGKTKVGAETVRHWVKDFNMVNLIGPTADDVRDAMIEGESGVLAVCPADERPYYAKSDRKLKWPNGAISLLFSAEEPDRLRNKQHKKLWCDELAAWRYSETWDQAQFGLRLGSNPQAIVTTTPKPTKIVKELTEDPTTHVTRGTTYENRDNLADKFFKSIVAKYENTRLGRQELNAEILTDNPGALWTIQVFEGTRVNKAPKNLRRVIVGVDPAVTSNEESDEWGIVVCAEDDQSPPHYYCLEDASAVFTPDQACEKAIYLYNKWDADRIVAEVNNGGDMIEALLRTKQHVFAYDAVRATRGKYIRAEPIAALYEQGRAHHVGCFAALESQMTDYVPGITQKSPDRLDACVWSLTALSESSLAGGWLLSGAKKAREEAAEVKTTEQVIHDDNAQTLAQAQKHALMSQPSTSHIFGAEKMAGKVLTTKLAKPATNDKTPGCPQCGNKILTTAGPFKQCNQCGWNNRPLVNELGAPLQKVS